MSFKTKVQVVEETRRISKKLAHLASWEIFIFKNEDWNVDFYCGGITLSPVINHENEEIEYMTLFSLDEKVGLGEDNLSSKKKIQRPSRCC